LIDIEIDIDNTKRDCVRVKSDSLEWAAAVTSLLRRLYELPTWKPIVAERLAEHIAAVSVSGNFLVFHKKIS